MPGDALVPAAAPQRQRTDGTDEGISRGSPAADWYAVQVKRCEEHRVVRHLAMRAIPTFLPLIESIGRRGRGGTRLEPLFLGYVFVQLQALEADTGHWYAVRWAPGVRRILGAEDSPVPMPAEAMDAIRARVRDLGFVRPGARFSAGSRVRIRSGPLAGLKAIFDRPISRAGRVLVLLELLGQIGRTEVDQFDLESA